MFISGIHDDIFIMHILPRTTSKDLTLVSREWAREIDRETKSIGLDLERLSLMDRFFDTVERIYVTDDRPDAMTEIVARYDALVHEREVKPLLRSNAIFDPDAIDDSHLGWISTLTRLRFHRHVPSIAMASLQNLRILELVDPDKNSASYIDIESLHIDSLVLILSVHGKYRAEADTLGAPFLSGSDPVHQKIMHVAISTLETNWRWSRYAMRCLTLMFPEARSVRVNKHLKGRPIPETVTNERVRHDA